MSADKNVGSGAETSARDQLVLSHMALLHHIVGRLVFDAPDADREDLLGFGMLGLIEAADSFDPGRGLKFSTYAFPRIRGAILDELRRMDFLPRGRREKVRELERAMAGLAQRLGRAPSPEEIAAEMRVPLEEVDAILLSARTGAEVSIDVGDRDDGGTSEELAEMLADPRSDDPVGSAEWEEQKVGLIRAIGALPSAEKTVITLYYGEELMLKDIGKVMGVTESRVSQIHTRALYRLNQALGGPSESARAAA
jgi:RNA polymerase sigma factor for flagellar operon FliA